MINIPSVRISGISGNRCGISCSGKRGVIDSRRRISGADMPLRLYTVLHAFFPPHHCAFTPFYYLCAIFLIDIIN
jgi:hypothetical protein